MKNETWDTGDVIRSANDPIFKGNRYGGYIIILKRGFDKFLGVSIHEHFGMFIEEISRAIETDERFARVGHIDIEECLKDTLKEIISTQQCNEKITR